MLYKTIKPWTLWTDDEKRRGGRKRPPRCVVCGAEATKMAFYDDTITDTEAELAGWRLDCAIELCDLCFKMRCDALKEKERLEKQKNLEGGK